MRKLILLVLAVGMLLTSTFAVDTPAKLTQIYVLNVVSNGHGPGTVGEYWGVGGNILANGTLSFKKSIQFPGEPADEIVGTVTGRHIVFTRTRPGSFVQKYDGWFFEKAWQKPHEMAGTFSHNGVNQYGWYGWLSIPKPR